MSDVLSKLRDFQQKKLDVLFKDIRMLLGLPYPGASTPYKRWSKYAMEKVRGGVSTAFFQEFGGNDKFINCSINFLSKLIVFHTGIGQHKDV